MLAGLLPSEQRLIASGCVQVAPSAADLSLDVRGDAVFCGLAGRVAPVNRRRVVVVTTPLPGPADSTTNTLTQCVHAALLAAVDAWLPGIGALPPPEDGEWTACRCLVSRGRLGAECVVFRVAAVRPGEALRQQVAVDVMAWYQWGDLEAVTGSASAQLRWPLMGAIVAAVRSLHQSSDAVVEHVACPECCTGGSESGSGFGRSWGAPCLIPKVDVLELLASPDLTPRSALACGARSRHRVPTPTLSMSLLPCDDVGIAQPPAVAHPVPPLVDQLVWRRVEVVLFPERERFIGEGSFGKVLRAWLARDRAVVAVKLAHEGKFLSDLSTEVESFKALAGESPLEVGVD